MPHVNSSVIGAVLDALHEPGQPPLPDRRTTLARATGDTSTGFPSIRRAGASSRGWRRPRAGSPGLSRNAESRCAGEIRDRAPPTRPSLLLPLAFLTGGNCRSVPRCAECRERAGRARRGRRRAPHDGIQPRMAAPRGGTQVRNIRRLAGHSVVRDLLPYRGVRGRRRPSVYYSGRAYEGGPPAEGSAAGPTPGDRPGDGPGRPGGYHTADFPGRAGHGDRGLAESRREAGAHPAGERGDRGSGPGATPTPLSRPRPPARPRAMHRA